MRGNLLPYKGKPEDPVKADITMRLLRGNIAFTLIELLVVMAIIALLIALLLPALTMGREAGRVVQCLSNAKQMGTCLQKYFRDADGRFPVYGEAGGVPPGEKILTWRGEFARYMSDHPLGYRAGGGNAQSVWLCPTYEKRVMPDTWAVGYAFNNPNVVAYYPGRGNNKPPWARQPWRIAAWTYPSAVMAMGEVAYVHLGGIYSAYLSPGIYPGDVNVDSDRDGTIDSNTIVIHANNLTDQYYNNLAPRHPRRSATLMFIDGHADNQLITDIMALPEENNDLWGREFVVSKSNGIP